MKHEVSTLEGALLDAAVAKAEGWIENPGGGYHAPILIEVGEDKPLPGTEWRMLCSWSTEWQHGGPIVERERITVDYGRGPTNTEWSAMVNTPSGSWVWKPPLEKDVVEEFGPTPLIAAMRAYVASKFGDKVELP